MTTDRLAALDAPATPAPWEFDGLDAIVCGPSASDLVASVDRPADAELIVALRNSLPAIVALREAADFHASVTFTNPEREGGPDHQWSGPELLLGIAAYMDRKDDEAGVSADDPEGRRVQQDVRRWAADLAAALAALDAALDGGTGHVFENADDFVAYLDGESET